MSGLYDRNERPMKIDEGSGGGGGGTKTGIGVEPKKPKETQGLQSPEPTDPPIIKHGIGATRKNAKK